MYAAAGMVETIQRNGALLALIVRREFDQPGVSFVTPAELSQQLAVIRHPRGHRIPAHVHNPLPRQVLNTQEVLVVRRGQLRVDFYTDDRDYLESRILRSGDVILLASGGHGFHVLESCELIEVNQGPHAGAADKTRFEGVADCDVRVVAAGESFGQPSTASNNPSSGAEPVELGESP